jgi:hypothetical protein
MNPEGTRMNQKVSKIQGVLTGVLAESKRHAKIFEIHKEMTDFLKAIQKTLSILHISIGEITNLLIEDDNDQFSGIFSLIYEIVELQLKTASLNLSEQNQNPQPNDPRRSTILLQDNVYTGSSGTRNSRHSFGSNLVKSTSVNEDESINEESSQSKRPSFISLKKNSNIKAKKSTFFNEQSNLKGSLVFRDSSDFVLKYPTEKYSFLDPTIKPSGNRKTTGRGEYNYVVEDTLDVEAENLLVDYEMGRLHKFDHVKNPLVLIRLSEKLAQNILESQTLNKVAYDDFIGKINKGNYQKDNYKVIKELLEQVISKSFHVSGINPSAYIPEFINRFDFSKIELILKDRLEDGFKILFRHICEIWFEIQMANKQESGMNTDFTFSHFAIAEEAFKSKIQGMEESLLSTTTQYIEARDMNLYLQMAIKSHELETFELKTQIEDKQTEIDLLKEGIVEHKRESDIKSAEWNILAKENSKFVQIFKISFHKLAQMQDMILHTRELVKPFENQSTEKMELDSTSNYVRAFKEFFTHHVKLINSLSQNQEFVEPPDFNMFDENTAINIHTSISDLNKKLKKGSDLHKRNSVLGSQNNMSSTNLMFNSIADDKNSKFGTAQESNSGSGHVQRNSEMGEPKVQQANAIQKTTNTQAKKQLKPKRENTIVENGRAHESEQRVKTEQNDKQIEKRKVRPPKKITNITKITKTSTRQPSIVSESNNEIEKVHPQNSMNANVYKDAINKSENIELVEKSRKHSIVDETVGRSLSQAQAKKRSCVVKPTPNVKNDKLYPTNNKEVDFVKEKSLLANGNVDYSGDPKDEVSSNSLSSEIQRKKEASFSQADFSENEFDDDFVEFDDQRLEIDAKPIELKNSKTKPEPQKKTVIDNTVTSVPNATPILSKKNPTTKLSKTDTATDLNSSSKIFHDPSNNAEINKSIVKQSHMISKPVHETSEYINSNNIDYQRIRNYEKRLSEITEDTSYSELPPKDITALGKGSNSLGKESDIPKKISPELEQNQRFVPDNQPHQLQSSKILHDTQMNQQDKIQTDKQNVDNINTTKNQLKAPIDTNEVLQIIMNFKKPMAVDLYYKLKAHLKHNGFITNDENKLIREETSSCGDLNLKHFPILVRDKSRKYQNKKTSSQQIKSLSFDIHNIVSNIGKTIDSANLDRAIEDHFYQKTADIENQIPNFYMIPHQFRNRFSKDEKQPIYRPGLKIKRRNKEFSVNVRRIEECFVSYKITPPKPVFELAKTTNQALNRRPASRIQSKNYLTPFEVDNNIIFSDSSKDKGLIFDQDLKRIHNLIYFGVKTADYRNLTTGDEQKDKPIDFKKKSEPISSKFNKGQVPLVTICKEFSENVAKICQNIVGSELIRSLDSESLLSKRITKTIEKLRGQFIENHQTCGKGCVHITMFAAYLEKYLIKLVKKNPISLPVIKLDNPEPPRLSAFIGHIANR